MIWLLIFTLAGIVLFNRYLLLEPRLPIRLPNIIRQALQYSAPCLLTAICGPILLGDTGISGLATNPYSYAALFSIGCALLINNMLLSVLASLAGFYTLLYMLG
ncbi:MAG TPA: AzlD domain-containing protein [Thiopseudomonas sp.]|nr:AzlD domain-containing protein [Thiopseudomonas sp.]